MGKYEELHLALTNNNHIDLCRIIFIKHEDKYDIKLDLFKEPFEVEAYPLFSETPISIDANSNNSDVSYHYGRDNYPVLIHIKDKDDVDGGFKYKTIPLHNIVAPNTLGVYPLPIMKIEFSSSLSKLYKKKSHHVENNIEKFNAVEIFMARPNYNFPIEGYDDFIFVISNFEYLSSNSRKHLEDKTKSIELNGAKMNYIRNKVGMDLLIMMYTHDKDLEKTRITFIDNMCSDDIVMNTILKQPEEAYNPLKGEYSYIEIGPSNIKMLMANQDNQTKLIANSISARTVLRQKDHLVRNALYKRALESRYRLLGALIYYSSKKQ